jgi:hypothetical protein
VILGPRWRDGKLYKGCAQRLERITGLGARTRAIKGWRDGGCWSRSIIWIEIEGPKCGKWSKFAGEAASEVPITAT